MFTPEDQARENIARMLADVGWEVRNLSQAHISAARGLAIRNFPLKTGHGFADYLLYVNGSAAGVSPQTVSDNLTLGSKGNYSLA